MRRSRVDRSERRAVHNRDRHPLLDASPGARAVADRAVKRASPAGGGAADEDAAAVVVALADADEPAEELAVNICTHCGKITTRQLTKWPPKSSANETLSSVAAQAHGHRPLTQSVQQYHSSD